jgi:uncharacterized protein (DUF1697 family)
MKKGDLAYVAILRGINVSGQKIIRMEALKHMFGSLGFSDVSTYIQSGNVIFRSPETAPDALVKKISGRILKNFGFEVPVIVRTSDQLENIIRKNPFTEEKNILKDKLHVTFLSEEPERDKIEIIESLSFAFDRFMISGKEIYLYCPGGYGNTKLSNSFFESKLKVTATTRNWNTVNKLLELSLK